MAWWLAATMGLSGTGLVVLSGCCRRRPSTPRLPSVRQPATHPDNTTHTAHSTRTTPSKPPSPESGGNVLLATASDLMDATADSDADATEGEKSAAVTSAPAPAPVSNTTLPPAKSVELSLGFELTEGSTQRSLALHRPGLQHQHHHEPRRRPAVSFIPHGRLAAVPADQASPFPQRKDRYIPASEDAFHHVRDTIREAGGFLPDPDQPFGEDGRPKMVWVGPRRGFHPAHAAPSTSKSPTSPH